MPKFLLIEEYITQSKTDRQTHLNLAEDCIEIGGSSRDFRGLLAHHLGTVIPHRSTKVLCAHACHNGNCSNVRHLYWGTFQENTLDSYEAGRKLGGFAAAAPGACKNWGSKGGRAGKGRKLSEEHKRKIGESLRKVS